MNCSVTSGGVPANSPSNTGGNTTDELAEVHTKGASGLKDQGNDGSSFSPSQLGILMSLPILSLLGRAKRTGGVMSTKSGGRDGMSDGEIKEQGRSVKSEPEIRSQTILIASFGNGLEPRLSKE